MFAVINFLRFPIVLLPWLLSVSWGTIVRDSFGRRADGRSGSLPPAGFDMTIGIVRGVLPFSGDEVGFGWLIGARDDGCCSCG
jgi:hypothetical protein